MTKDTLCAHCKHRGCIRRIYEPPLGQGDSRVEAIVRIWCKKGAFEEPPDQGITTDCSEFERVKIPPYDPKKVDQLIKDTGVKIKGDKMT